MGAFGLVTVGVFVGYWYSQKSRNFITIPLAEFISPTSVPTTTTPTTKPSTPIPTLSPSSFGFIEPHTLSTVGIKALFPKNVKIILQLPKFYVAELGNSQKITFGLKSYDGGGRRDWFIKNYPFAKDFTFISYQANNHSGYIAYSPKKAEQNSYFYFFAKDKTNMMVINAYSEDYKIKIFNSDPQVFKSFINSIFSISATDISFQLTPEFSEVFRSSSERITVWQDDVMGLKVTTPKWTEYRIAQSRDANGKFVYSDWHTQYPSARTVNTSYFSQPIKSINITGNYTSETYLDILPADFSGYSFSQVVTTLLFPAGSCTTERPKDQVLQNLRLLDTKTVGAINGQLRGMDEQYSQTNDCRSRPTWLYQAKDGTYFFSHLTFENDSNNFRLELVQ